MFSENAFPFAIHDYLNSISSSVRIKMFVSGILIVVLIIVVNLYLKFTRHERFLKKYPGPKRTFLFGNALDMKSSAGMLLI